MIVARESTPLNPAEMLARIVEMYQETYGRTPTARAASWLLTLLWHENAGGRAIQNHNWGNVMAGPSWPGDKWEAPAHDEGEPDFFRAYPTHEDGSNAWWKVLHRRDGTHLRIITAAERGDARAFFAAVTTPHPSTGLRYCSSCGPGVAREYRRIHDQILESGLVRSLPIGTRPAGNGGAGALLVLVGFAFAVWMKGR